MSIGKNHQYEYVIAEAVKNAIPISGIEKGDYFISVHELLTRLGADYNKGLIPWGTNEIFKDIIGECRRYG